MIKSLRYLAFYVLIGIVRRIKKVKTGMFALGIFKKILSLDFLQLIKVNWSRKWAKWIEENVKILKIEVLPTISPPLMLNNIPP